MMARARQGANSALRGMAVDRAAVFAVVMAAGLLLLLLTDSSAALAGPFQPRNRDKDSSEKDKSEQDSSDKDKDDAGAADSAPAEAPPAEAAPAAAQNDAPAAGKQHNSQTAAPPIPLRPNLRMVIRPTILGLVPNRDPEGYGELFARVMASEGGRVQLYFEVKELSPRAKVRGSWLASLRESEAEEEAAQPVAPGAALSSSELEALAEPELPLQRALGLADFGHRIQDTRIRRGDLFFSGLDSAPMASPPLFWGDGLWQASGSGIWLSRALLAQLKETGEASWQRFEMNGPAPGGSAPEPAKLLLVNAKARYPCVVNGARVMLPALYCRDSLGLAEYWIHDDPANALLLKLSFQPPLGMKPIESIVELDESDTPVEGRDPRLPKLLVKREGGADEDDGYSGQAYNSSNQFGGQPRPAPPGVGVAQRVDGGGNAADEEEDQDEEGADGDADSESGTGSDSGAGARGNAGIDTGAADNSALPGAPSDSYLPPSIDELVACGGGYAIVEIDF